MGGHIVHPDVNIFKLNHYIAIEIPWSHRRQLQSSILWQWAD